MELIDALIIINLLGTVISAIVAFYALARITILDKTLKGHEEAIRKILTTKIPITIGPDGRPMLAPPGMQLGMPPGGIPPNMPPEHNPITG